MILPENCPPEQARAVHEIRDDLLERIEAHYGMAVQDWRCGEDADDDPFTDTQLDLFENDLDDLLPFRPNLPRRVATRREPSRQVPDPGASPAAATHPAHRLRAPRAPRTPPPADTAPPG